MSSTAVSTAAEIPLEPIAPWWHTLLVLAVVGIGSVASFYENGLPNLNLPGISLRLSGYYTVIAQEWILVLLVWLALRHRGMTFSNLVGGSWNTLGKFFRDLGLGIGLIVIVVPVVNGLIYLIGTRSDKTLAALTPKTWFELFVWFVLAWSAAFGEELVFRGYLMRQFGAWTGSRGAGLILQGVAFGLGHGYYRWAMLAIMVHGWLLGLLAWWRKSLRPGMLAHGVQDSLGGIVAYLTIK
jgi:membrane protease YdiL (CAAX protease family)